MALPQGWRSAAAPLKLDTAVEVWALELQGQPVVLKLWRAGSLKRWVQSVAGTTPAHRHARGARLLADLGEPTARVLALGNARDPGPIDLLIMERIPGRSVLDHLANPPTVKHQHELARRVGSQVGRLAGGGLFNRDHKPSNLIVDDRTGQVVVIDAGGVRKHRSARARWRMLASLIIEPLGVGRPPRATLVWRCLVAEAAAWLASGPGLRVDSALPARQRRRILRGVARASARRVARIVVAHGDPTPRISPLPGGMAGAESGQSPHGQGQVHGRDQGQA